MNPSTQWRGGKEREEGPSGGEGGDPVEGREEGPSGGEGGVDPVEEREGGVDPVEGREK